MSSKAPPILLLAAGLATASLQVIQSGAAWGAENWRYCLARDETNRQVFISDSFRSSDPLDDLERTFNAWLDRAGLPHSWGICPRAASAAAVEAERQNAELYNRQLGLQSRAVSWPAERS